MNRFDCVIWDWNGTLIDDVAVSVDAVNDTLTLYGMPHIDMQQYHSLMDGDVRRFYAHLFDFDEVPYATLTGHFSHFYDRHIEEARLMKNAEEALQRVREKGVLQVIVSASNNEKVFRDTESFGIQEYFDELLGAQDNLIGSKIGRAEAYLKRKGILPERTLVVGDMLHDKEMADAIGTQCVLIPNGHQHKSLLSAAGAVILNDIVEIPKII